MNERIQNQGMLRELELEAKRLRISIHGLLHTLREETNQFKDLSEMNAELIHEQAFEVSQKIDKYQGYEAKIKALKTALGIE